jgi:hypothetical protein
MAPYLQTSFNELQQLAADLRAREQRGAPPPPQIAQFRNFPFERDNGGFAINSEFFDLDRDDAVPQAGTFEVWNLEVEPGK